MLALSFLVVIGVVLVASGFHQEVSKSIIYSCLGFLTRRGNAEYQTAR